MVYLGKDIKKLGFGLMRLPQTNLGEFGTDFFDKYIGFSFHFQINYAD